MNLVNRRTNFLVDGPVSRAFLQIRLDVVDESHFVSENSLSQGSFLAPEVGCGPGNTASELSATSYESCVGVNISKKKEDGKWPARQTFFAADFTNFRPNLRVDTMLLRSDHS